MTATARMDIFSKPYSQHVLLQFLLTNRLWGFFGFYDHVCYQSHSVTSPSTFWSIRDWKLYSEHVQTVYLLQLQGKLLPQPHNIVPRLDNLSNCLWGEHVGQRQEGKNKQWGWEELAKQTLKNWTIMSEFDLKLIFHPHLHSGSFCALHACTVPTAKCSASSYLSPLTASLCSHQSVCSAAWQRSPKKQTGPSPLEGWVKSPSPAKNSPLATSKLQSAGTHCCPKPLLLTPIFIKVSLTYISLNAQ